MKYSQFKSKVFKQLNKIHDPMAYCRGGALQGVKLSALEDIAADHWAAGYAYADGGVQSAIMGCLGHIDGILDMERGVSLDELD